MEELKQEIKESTVLSDVNIKTSKITIHLCPECKEYIGKRYNFCPYCAKELFGKTLLTEQI